MNLIGKTAIVTGAAQGIGQQYARRMYEMGMNVVAADVSSCDETVDAMYGPGKAFAAEMDVTDFGQVAEVVAKAVEEYGGVDVLVNNAALYEYIACRYPPHAGRRRRQYYQYFVFGRRLWSAFCSPLFRFEGSSYRHDQSDGP
jgi:NAD(P)-dependent dehydrogenase (short-subunit alcohol dehydrogenase family)